MKSTDFSPQFSEVWGENASSDTITFPIPSTTTTSGRASLDAGFTSVNMTVLAAGGIPPFGQDFNGILKMLSTSAQNYESGNVAVWSSEFATAIGGYPQYALVQYEGAYYTSSTDDNATTPGVSGSAWVGLLSGYALTSTVEASQFWTPVTTSQYLTPPSWAKYLEVIQIGGGGGGAGCQGSSASASISGAGGGGGGVLHSRHAVDLSMTISQYIGAPGTSGSGASSGGKGGDTYLTINGTTVATAGGGTGGDTYTTGGSSGGAGGKNALVSGVEVGDYTGSSGFDGQLGTIRFNGNGAPGYLGCGAGRGGSEAGEGATSAGAGGGGAYDSAFSGAAYSGGVGGSGKSLYRWIP